jgi:hypothetical protein
MRPCAAPFVATDERPIRPGRLLEATHFTESSLKLCPWRLWAWRPADSHLIGNMTRAVAL